MGVVGRFFCYIYYNNITNVLSIYNYFAKKYIILLVSVRYWLYRDRLPSRQIVGHIYRRAVQNRYRL